VRAAGGILEWVREQSPGYTKLGVLARPLTRASPGGGESSLDPSASPVAHAQRENDSI
jgi:hypothetical protein